TAVGVGPHHVNVGVVAAEALAIGDIEPAVECAAAAINGNDRSGSDAALGLRGHQAVEEAAAALAARDDVGAETQSAVEASIEVAVNQNLAGVQIMPNHQDRSGGSDCRHAEEVAAGSAGD